jgi:hypothetical protein
MVITFRDYTPAPRYDGNPWTEVDIEESDTTTLSDDTVWSLVETIALSPVDADPENPASRSLTTEDATDTIDLWYRLVFRDGTGDEQQTTQPVQNTSLATSYGTITELARILKIRTPTEDQRGAMARVLIAAAEEVNNEINLPDDTYLTSGQVALATQVNLERAAELWNFQMVQFGVILGSEVGPVHIGRDTWKKHSITLGPLKQGWGFA